MPAGSRSAAGICVAVLGRVANSFCAHLLPLRKPQVIGSFPCFKSKAPVSYLTKLEQRMFLIGFSSYIGFSLSSGLTLTQAGLDQDCSTC